MWLERALFIQKLRAPAHIFRKNILEYDEPMEHQRQAFYSIRQPVLEHKGIKVSADVVHEYVSTPIVRAFKRLNFV